MVRLEKLNITFLHIAKNAGTSIEYWLKENHDGDVYEDDLKHQRPGELRKLFYDLGWTFAVTRNPWDRVVSWYKFFRQQDRMPVSFEDYIDIAIDNPSKVLQFPFPEIEYTQYCHYVIRFDNLIEDFKVIQQKTNCDNPLYQVNKSDNNGMKYVDFYDKTEYIDKVARYYKHDIEAFNYKYGG